MGNEMLDTQYLFQPRGPGTGWCFRIATPPPLVGTPDPTTGKSFKTEIRRGLKTRSLHEARGQRDVILGDLRVLEAERGDWSRDLRRLNAEARSDDDYANIAAIECFLEDEAEKIESRKGPKEAKRWYKRQTTGALTLSDAHDRYVATAGKSLAKSSLSNLKTAVSNLTKFVGEDVLLEEITELQAFEFATEFLPSQKSPKAPEGPIPATIRRQISQLSQIWGWAMDAGFLAKSPMGSSFTIWTRKGPKQKVIDAATKKRRPFTPEETQALLKATPVGSREGDIIRIALLTGVRLEEIAGLTSDQIKPDCTGYSIAAGKTESAKRYIPLVGVAQEVVKARLAKCKNHGPIFPEAPLRKSTGKRGGSISQAFTRLRREVLGRDTDGVLAEHSFRHTWRTAARRAGVDLRTTSEMGGWVTGRNETDAPYDDGLERKQYEEAQKKIAGWLRDNGFLKP